MADEIKNDGRVEVWEVTPHMDPRFDHAIFPVKDDPDGRGALDHAKNVLENLWDTADDVNVLDIKVSLRRTWAEEGDLVDPLE